MDPAALPLDVDKVAEPLVRLLLGLVCRTPAEHLVARRERQMIGELRLELGLEVARSLVWWQGGGSFALRHSTLARCTGCQTYRA